MANPANEILTVDGLMATAFNRPREARSNAYKAGVRAVLTRFFEGITLPRTFETGTAEADAFFSGQDEGRLIVARACEAEQIA